MDNETNSQENGGAQQPHFNPGAVSIYGQGDALDNFPVLKAFQQYIDSEQSKAHKRLMMVCSFFGVLVVVVVAVFLAIISNLRTGDTSSDTTIRALTETNSNLQKQLLDQSLRMNDRILQMSDRKNDASGAASAELQRKNMELQTKIAAMETEKTLREETLRREKEAAAQREKEEAARREREEAARREKEAAEAQRLAAEAEKLAAEREAQTADASAMDEKVKKLRKAETLLREKVARLKERESKIVEDEKRLHDKEVRLQRERLYGESSKRQAADARAASDLIDPTDAELDALALPPDPEETAPAPRIPQNAAPAPQKQANAKPVAPKPAEAKPAAQRPPAAQKPATRPAAKKPANTPVRQPDGSIRYFEDDDDSVTDAAISAADAALSGQRRKFPAKKEPASLQIGDWSIPMD